MSVESAVAYIKRMRSDEEFRQAVNAYDGDEAVWAFVASEGFEFTMMEFKQAQDVIYQEYGITPM
ncbi:Nif11-like leader peptide family natural product precursor [Pseudothauera rhizosphaerae]|uniref:Nif11-like leader peptide family natural product n=1 Tax=Pseudothauera rhizosphaerae TaxID=2565932 RepID=A0A4S4A8P0_9RHOO|nr:Nif11-like leader peptide family natural product precursor [Pseudothauera rhizosphaerae]THF55135.1 Nif11-like leader peptide family natural product precursor [Pseudothauera rhizosphaerae]